MPRLLVAIAAILFLSLPAVAAERPNVVLIVADDFGWRDLACYGSKYYRTPNIDQLAKDGIRFTDYYAACPVCSPTRASIMTGKYPARLNLTDWLPGRGDRPDQRLKRPVINQHLPLEEITIAEALKAAGYRTGHIGKWHLGGGEFEPRKQGFDINIGGDHTGSPRSYFAPFRNKSGSIPGLEDAPEGQYLTDRLTDEAVKFIQASKDRPFFLYLPHYTVHIPLRAKKEIIAKYQGTPQGGKQSNPIYAAMIESLDEGVGRIVKTLDELKLSDNTIVIFTSDNGGLATQEGANTPATSNAPLREGKGFLYEGGIRVPLVVKWPGVVKPGTVADQVACSIDLFPTLLEAASVSRESKTSAVDGVSLIPAFRGESLKNRALFWHYPHYANQGGKPGGALRKGHLKLIEFYEDSRRELFDVKKDPSESRNLSGEQTAAVSEMAAELDRWRREVGAKMPTPNPDFVPNPQAKNGPITMHARTAQIHGIQLRYEPLPHKNTLGFWTRPDDYATFDFTVAKPGTFTVEILQGCGKASGGSEVMISLGEPGGAATGGSVTFTVKETGGFQNFEAREVGTLKVEKPGRYTLTVKPKSKPGPAVMDLRQIVLKPVK